MDKEKILAWISGTPEGQAFKAELLEAEAVGVEKTISARVKEKKLFLPDQVDAMLGTARAEQKKLAEDETALVAACNEIHALNKLEPVSAIRAKLEKHPAGPVREAEIGRMAAEAKLFAIKNSPAPTDDKPVAADTRAEFKRKLDAGHFGSPAALAKRAKAHNMEVAAYTDTLYASWLKSIPTG
ncbi:MAG: hypothetical protein IT464_12775 [Planctomycetes bacterium]|nr:hypothetical protein [Planctomycetota bacterium]